jgi:hypothetical protein
LDIGACQNIHENLNLHPNLNKNSPWTHTELEFYVLGVAGILVKYVVNLSKRDFEK